MTTLLPLPTCWLPVEALPPLPPVAVALPPWAVLLPWLVDELFDWLDDEPLPWL